MTVTIALADLQSPEVAALVAAHNRYCDGTAPPESCHNLAVQDLVRPDIMVWAAHQTGQLVGIGALKLVGQGHGEVKSMHTRAEARGHGVARAIMQTVLQSAQDHGLTALWLETGAHEAFAPARALYQSLGFVETGAFGDYAPDPHSRFYVRHLAQSEDAA